VRSIQRTLEDFTKQPQTTEHLQAKPKMVMSTIHAPYLLLFQGSRSGMMNLFRLWKLK